MTEDQGVKIKRSRSFWREALERYRSSGMGAKEFCAEEGLAESTFHKWRHRLSEAADGGAQLVEVTGMLSGVGTESYEVVLSGGRILRVGGRFKSDSVLQLVRLLERC